MTTTGRNWSRLAVLAAIVPALVVAVSPIAQAATKPLPAHSSVTTTQPSRADAADYASIFSGEHADLADSGWATCPAPIEWTVDTRGLTAAEKSAQIANITVAFATWSQASGLTFTYGGEEDVTYDDADFTVTPADGQAVETRHIYLDFLQATESARLTDGTVGLGSPSQVMPQTKEIVGGEAVFRAAHVRTATTKELRNLYLHEIGHVLGLAHAQSKLNIMYPIVSDRVQLGAGDVRGVQSMTKPCTKNDD